MCSKGASMRSKGGSAWWSPPRMIRESCGVDSESVVRFRLRVSAMRRRGRKGNLGLAGRQSAVE
eukprot:1591638-Pleurochrysis_carterae.AAC.1